MADFLHTDLGQRQRGDIVEVTLTSGANVRLMDTSNFNQYRRGERHSYHGGLAQQSPTRLAIPNSGHWHLTVDTQGLCDGTRSSVKVINGSAFRPLPAIRDARPQLRDIADNLEQAPIAGVDADREYDIFISHATEDKEAVVRPLAIALQGKGLRVWYDEFEMRIGDSLRRKIDAGIAASRFEIVVLSKPFFAKQWPQYELDGLVTMAVSGKQVLLPLWHEISLDEVTRYSPSLADKIALRTSDFSILAIADEIAAVVSAEK